MVRGIISIFLFVLLIGCEWIGDTNEWWQETIKQQEETITSTVEFNWPDEIISIEERCEHDGSPMRWDYNEQRWECPICWFEDHEE